jgi:phage tail P2-like protein
MKKLDEITIADLMPDSISSDREVSATARAIDPQLKAVSEGVDLPLILASIDTLSAGVLEHLAAQYDLTAWDSAWPISTKRAVLKTAIADKRKKGTRGAVQRAIEAVAPLATITEWWQKTPQGTPHTFEIDVLQDGEAVDAETVADVIAQVNDSKPVRSHFTFSVGQQSEGNTYLSGVIRTIAYARVRSSGMTAVQTEIDAGVLAALRGMNIRRIIEFSHMGEMPEPTPPAPALPTVEEIGYLGVNNLDVVQISSGASKALRKLDANVPIPYKFRYVYSSISYLSAGSGSLRSAGIFDFVDIMNGSSFILGVKNISSSTQVFFAIRTVYCDSGDATVITVYDSSNNPYNAFKYTSDGTDYYYVLDGTQTDWTDDLESIGYHLLSDLNAWVDLTHEDRSINNFTTGVYLYDDNGNLIEGNNTYTIIGAFKSDGTEVSTTYLKMRAGWNSGVSKYLAEVIVTDNKVVTLARVTYKIE